MASVFDTKYSAEELWRNDIDEMAEAVNEYILDSLDGRLDYRVLNSDRSEIESGYEYELDDIYFDFSLAGPANSDQEILSGSSRRAVFQFEGDRWPEVMQSLDEAIDTELREKDVAGLTVYEMEFSAPF